MGARACSLGSFVEFRRGRGPEELRLRIPFGLQPPFGISVPAVAARAAAAARAAIRGLRLRGDLLAEPLFVGDSSGIFPISFSPPDSSSELAVASGGETLSLDLSLLRARLRRAMLVD